MIALQEVMGYQAEAVSTEPRCRSDSENRLAPEARMAMSC